jgi:hypothetical protein
MHTASHVVVEQPVEPASLQSVVLAAPGIVLDVAIGDKIWARLGLTRDEARIWRAALGAALNSPG